MVAIAQEIQAVVLAGGRGTRITDLNGDRAKCLINIGSFPLIFYPLQLLQKYGFTEAIVVVLESQKIEIQQKLDRTPLKIKLEFITIPSDSDFGTADSLRHIHERIKTDVFLMTCDIIMDVDLFPLFNCFRSNDASVVSLLLDNAGSESDIVVPGPKTKYKQERDLIGINPQNNRLLFLASTSDFEETMKLPGHLLRANGKVVLHSALTDAHIYLMKKWVVDFLTDNQGLSTVKGELLPLVIKKQLSRPFVSENSADKPFSEVNMNTKMEDIFKYVPQDDLDKKVLDTNLNKSSRVKKTYFDELIRCFAVIAPKTSVGIRVNTIMGYCAANKKIFSIWDKLGTEKLISPTSTIKSSQISGECAVGDYTTISEKTSIKSSVFGSNCLVNPKTRISDSFIMNNVTVEEGVVIENCIICDKAVIKSGSVLKNCLIGFAFVVPEETKKEKVHLSGSESYMEIE